MPLSSGIMVFEVRGGLISGYFRSKFGVSLGMHFGDHLDLIFTSFWSHVVRFSRKKTFQDAVENLIDFGSDLGSGFDNGSSKNSKDFGNFWQVLEVRRQGRGRSRENSPNSPRLCQTILTRPSEGDGRIFRLRPCRRPPVSSRLLAE